MEEDGEKADENMADNKYKIKTHHEIQDFGSLKVHDPKHIGLEEVSPLEGKNGKFKDEIDDEVEGEEMDTTQQTKPETIKQESKVVMK